MTKIKMMVFMKNGTKTKEKKEIKKGKIKNMIKEKNNQNIEKNIGKTMVFQ